MIRRNIIWASLNSSSGTLLSFFVSIYIAREIDPGIFLKLSIIFSFILLSNVIVDMGNSNQLLLSKSLSRRRIIRLEQDMFVRSLCMSSIYIILNFLFQSSINLPILLLLPPLLLLLSYPYNFQGNLLFNRQKKFKTKLILSTISTLFGSSLAVLLTYLGYPSYAYAISQTLIPFLLAILIRYNLDLPFWPSFSSKLRLNLQNLDSSSFHYQLFDQIYPFLSKSFMFQLSPSLITPQFVKNDSFLYLPFKIFKKSIVRVTMSTWGPLTTSSTNLASKLNKFLLINAFISILIYLFVLLLGKSLIIHIIGSKWSLPDIYYLYLSILISSQFFSGQLTNCLNIYSKSFKKSVNISALTLIFILLSLSFLYLLDYLSIKLFIQLLVAAEIFKIILLLITYLKRQIGFSSLSHDL